MVKRFGRDVLAVDNVDLDVNRGELVTLLGPSGCGKTTILRMIAGLERPTEGEIRLDDDDVTRLPAYLRDVTMVFQSYALFPHMSVYENVAYGLKVARRPADEIRRRVAAALEMVGLGNLGDRASTALSGGQQQRVALARALVIEPRVLLFDEPLSNLDAKLRRRVRDDIRELQQRLNITSVYVTHDQEEALAISDRVVVMREGTIEQQGTPRELYARPATKFVADFIGTANFLPAQYDGSSVEVMGYRLAHVQDVPPGPVTLMVRPEAIEFARPGQPGLRAVYRLGAYLGPHSEYRFEVTGQELYATISGGGPTDAAPGDEVLVSFDPSGLWLLPRA